MDQVVAITLAEPNQYAGRVFYITDPPIDNAEWMNAFSVALTGRQVRRIPIGLWQFLAKTGDILNKFAFNFPMSSERFFRLTINEQVPYEATIELAGPSRVSIEEGVRKSVRWYMSYLAGDPTEQWTV